MATPKATAKDVGPLVEPSALRRASESSDPAVHKALGDLQSARMNRAALDVDPAAVAAADAAVEAATKTLADLGHE